MRDRKRRKLAKGNEVGLSNQTGEMSAQLTLHENARSVLLNEMKLLGSPLLSCLVKDFINFGLRRHL